MVRHGCSHRRFWPAGCSSSGDSLNSKSEVLMSSARRIVKVFATVAGVVWLGASTLAQKEISFSDPSKLPNPYRLEKGWPTLPKTMNGGHWGELIRVDTDPKGNIWVYHRCFNTEPEGAATC